MTVATERDVRSIDDLPDILADAGASGTQGFSEDFVEFFGSGHRFLRAGSRRVIVFRSEDLRRIAALPAAGNMPFEVISQRAYLDGDAASRTRDEDRANLVRILFNQVFTANPPLHGPTRQLFARPLSPKAMPTFQPLVDRLLDALVEEVAGQGEIDFAFQFTEQLTARFWGALLGMNAAEQDEVVEHVRAMTPFFFIERTDPETIAVNAATGAYLDMVAAAVERTLAAGGNAMLEQMAADFAAIDHPARPESIALSLAANLIDGFHTAALAAANAVHQLFRHPAALAAVQADRSLVDAALAEGLRMSAPVILTHRYALDAFDYGGVHFPKGTALAMLWAAGNRDPDVFEEPSRYRIDRTQRAEATFGGGIHLCPGRNIAKLIARAVVERVTRTDIVLTPGDDFEWIARSTMRQPYRMPVTITRL